MVVVVHHVMIAKEQVDGLVEDLQETSCHFWMKFEVLHPVVVLIFAFVRALTRHPP